MNTKERKKQKIFRVFDKRGQLQSNPSAIRLKLFGQIAFCQEKLGHSGVNFVLEHF